MGFINGNLRRVKVILYPVCNFYFTKFCTFKKMAGIKKMTEFKGSGGNSIAPKTISANAASASP